MRAREQGTGRKDKEILKDSLIHLNILSASLWVWKRVGERGTRGGDDTSKTDRKTGRRRWEMERKGGEREQERAPLPSLNLSCSDQ